MMTKVLHEEIRKRGEKVASRLSQKALTTGEIEVLAEILVAEIQWTFRQDLAVVNTAWLKREAAERKRRLRAEASRQQLTEDVMQRLYGQERS